MEMEFPPKISKSNINCCVYGCKSRACRNDTVRFYNFPQKNESVVLLKNKLHQEEKLDRFNAWVKVLKMGKTVTKTMRVCSLHFVTDDFIPSTHQVRRLKKTSVLSVNLPSSSIDTNPDPSTTKRASERGNRLHNRSLKKEQCLQNNINQWDHLLDGSTITEDRNRSDDEREVIGNVSQHLTNENMNPVTASSCENIDKKFEDATTQFPEIEELQKQFRDMSIQVSTHLITSKFSSLITTDEELSTLTGIPNLILLKTIKKLVDKKKSSSSHFNSKFDNLEIIVMTFIKFKQNMSYAMLSVSFKTCTAETCREKILDMIDTLYECLKPAIYWPSKENILKNIPQCFKEFANVRAVVDCIEISIQRSKNLCCQLNTYSYYKSDYTVKFMTAVTPAGLISFISKPYGGRSSDNIIFAQSGIVNKMDKKDDLMADQGFTVGELCKEHDINLIIPPFLQQKKQFSKEEAIRGRSIARARVHIERSNQRIKNFEIFSSTMPVGLVLKSKEIFTIICAIVNLSTPILKNDKF